MVAPLKAGRNLESASRILLLDDSKIVHERVKRAFGNKGIEIVATDYWYDVQRTLFSDTPPDVLIVDLQMPAINGQAVCRAVKRRVSIPIVLFSSESPSVLRGIALEVGADAALSKESTDGELVRTVLSLLERSRS